MRAFDASFQLIYALDVALMPTVSASALTATSSS